jgi:hypothetical protein
VALLKAILPSPPWRRTKGHDIGLPADPSGVPEQNHLRKFLPLIVWSSLLLGTILVTIWWWRPRVPFRDEWYTVNVVRAFDNGTLSWPQMWALHNEHRIVLPRLIDLGLIELTAWNRQVENTFDLVITVAAAALLLGAAWRSVPAFPSSKLSAISVALLIFSLSQYDNWLDPFQIAFLATGLGVSCCVWALSHREQRPRHRIAMVAGGLIATFSSFAGLLTWYIFLPSVISRWRHWALAWVGLAASITVPYFVGFRPLTSSRGSLPDLAGYALTYIGSPLLGIPSGTGTPWPAMGCGALGIMVMAANLAALRMSKSRPAERLLWVEVAAFALATGVITALGRAGAFGVSQAMTSRYQNFSALWWVALLMVICLSESCLPGGRTRTVLRRCLLGLNRWIVPSWQPWSLKI